MNRLKVAAGNWKMNLDYKSGEDLATSLMDTADKSSCMVLIAVPSPYLYSYVQMAKSSKLIIAAQNCHQNESGAYTGETSVSMLDSIGIKYCLVGHSERRQYNHESDDILKEKIDRCLSATITPIFCCGESLEIREAGNHKAHVQTQLENSIFHLDANAISSIIIAYEPIWAIGTGKTATPDQAQEMHAHIRSCIQEKYGDVAETISILYGGSVKPANAQEIFAKRDVDGGLVGGASLKAETFIPITESF